MLDEIQHICEILDDEGFTTKNFLILMNERHISIEAYEMAKKMGLIEIKNKNTVISDLGSIFQSIRTKNTKDLNKSQNQFIFENCLFQNKELEKFERFLISFEEDGDHVYKLFEDEIEEQNIGDENIIRFLEELTVLEWKVVEKRFEITKDFVKILTKYKLLEPESKIGNSFERNKQNKNKTLKELELSLEERKKIGKLGEELALDYERSQLKEKGWTNRLYDFNIKNNKKNLVANQNLEVGYDISSYKTKTSDRVDKYIEVKSRKEKKKSFIISHHEILAAQKYSKIKESYFIYFYYNLGKEKPKKPTRIIPFEKLKIDICNKCPGLVEPSYYVDISHLFEEK
mgnify:CR=1 FL=1|tara:strand:- start:982 stop:2013 length:1032 start_codon:yes stop_codon:yes gene_type:complete